MILEAEIEICFHLALVFTNDERKREFQPVLGEGEHTGTSWGWKTMTLANYGENEV